MKIANSGNRGFTLLEMLVVLAISSMFVSFVFTSITKARAKSRDVRRVSDIRQIQEGLAIYATAYNLYPRSCTADCLDPLCASGEFIINGISDCLTSQLKTSGSMIAVPIDPLKLIVGICGEDNNFLYCYISDGSDYILRYELETDSILGQPKGWYSVWP